MHIDNVTIHITPAAPSATAITRALMEALGARSADAPTGEEPAAAPMLAPMPRIGQPWPGVNGIYAGLARGFEGEPDHHLVLLDALPEGDLDWAAAVQWAEGLGDGARLPTRFESALLYANLQDKVDTDRWHWTGTQYSAGIAWYQFFYYGTQGVNVKKYEARARAVRRFAA